MGRSVNRIYLDACSIIYLVEAASPFHSVIVERLSRIRAEPASRLITSRLSLLECRVNPLKRNDKQLLAAYDRFFAAERMLVIEISAEVVARAATLRALYGFKTPDAIHLASAIEAQVDLFLTGDSSLVKCPDLNVELLTSESS